MPDPATLRDSTQIVLESETLARVREDLESEFTLTIVEGEGRSRIVASPAVIKEVAAFLIRRGVVVP